MRLLSLDRHRPTSTMPQDGRRLMWALAFVVPAFLLLFGRLVQLQLVHGAEYFERTTNNFVKERTIEAARGQIVDRNGEVLADSRPAFNVYVLPAKYTAKMHDELTRVLVWTSRQALRSWERVQKAAEKNGERRILVA